MKTWGLVVEKCFKSAARCVQKPGSKLIDHQAVRPKYPNTQIPKYPNAQMPKCPEPLDDKVSRAGAASVIDAKRKKD